RMLRGVKVLGGVLVLGVVAAADVPARPAQAKVHPGIAHGEAFLATVRVGRIGPYKLQVAALRRHRSGPRTPQRFMSSVLSGSLSRRSRSASSFRPRPQDA